MTTKTSAWTDEERDALAKQRARSNRDALERDPLGHAIAIGRWEGHHCPEYERCSLCVDEARDCAAAVVGGLIGMAIEIRDRHACRVCGANMNGEGGPCRGCVRYA